MSAALLEAPPSPETESSARPSTSKQKKRLRRLKHLLPAFENVEPIYVPPARAKQASVHNAGEQSDDNASGRLGYDRVAEHDVPFGPDGVLAAFPLTFPTAGRGVRSRVSGSGGGSPGQEAGRGGRSPVFS